MSCKLFRLFAYVIVSHHPNLSKTGKHWGSFLTHCILYYPVPVLLVLYFHFSFQLSLQCNYRSSRTFPHPAWFPPTPCACTHAPCLLTDSLYFVYVKSQHVAVTKKEVAPEKNTTPFPD